jgi:hypothetical protein
MILVRLGKRSARSQLLDWALGSHKRSAGGILPFIVSICAGRPVSACLCSPSELMNVVSGRHHDQLPLHSFQQVPRATTPPGSAGRQSLRPQPATSTRPDANPAGGRRTTRGAWRNRRRSHRPPRRTVSLAARCGKVISWNQPQRPCPLRLVVELQHERSGAPACAPVRRGLLQPRLADASRIATFANSLKG